MQPRILTALAKDSAHLDSPLGVAHMLHHMPILGLGLTRQVKHLRNALIQEQKVVKQAVEKKNLPEITYKGKGHRPKSC